MNAQCLAWDGASLAVLMSKQWSNLLYHHDQRNTDVQITTKELGRVDALILSAPQELLKPIQDFLETRPLEEFVSFYRQACKQNLMGRRFRFHLMAVAEEWVIGMSVTSDRVQLRSVWRDGRPLAIGDEAMGAMVLMESRHFTASQAVGGCTVTDDRMFEHYDLDSEALVYDPENPLTQWQYLKLPMARSGLPFRSSGNVPEALKDYPCARAPAATGPTTNSGRGSGTTALIS